MDTQQHRNRRALVAFKHTSTCTPAVFAAVLPGGMSSGSTPDSDSSSNASAETGLTGSSTPSPLLGLAGPLAALRSVPAAQAAMPAGTQPEDEARVREPAAALAVYIICQIFTDIFLGFRAAITATMTLVHYVVSYFARACCSSDCVPIRSQCGNCGAQVHVTALRWKVWGV